jgi:hypothetical protein
MSPLEHASHRIRKGYGYATSDRGGSARGLPLTGRCTTWSASAGDPSIVVKYPQGEKRIVILANAHVVRIAFGSKDDLSAHDACATDGWRCGRPIAAGRACIGRRQLNGPRKVRCRDERPRQWQSGSWRRIHSMKSCFQHRWACHPTRSNRK